MSKAFIRPVGEYAFMSNDYPVLIILDNKVWYNAESIYQSYRAEDDMSKSLIRELPYRNIKDYESYFTPREDWENIKDEVLYLITMEKFTQHEDLAKKLIATGDVKILDGFLGDILMRVRKEIRDKR